MAAYGLFGTPILNQDEFRIKMDNCNRFDSNSKVGQFGGIEYKYGYNSWTPDKSYAKQELYNDYEPPKIKIIEPILPKIEYNPYSFLNKEKDSNEPKTYNFGLPYWLQKKSSLDY